MGQILRSTERILVNVIISHVAIAIITVISIDLVLYKFVSSTTSRVTNLLNMHVYFVCIEAHSICSAVVLNTRS